MNTKLATRGIRTNQWAAVMSWLILLGRQVIYHLPFLKEKAIDLEEKYISKTFVLVHNLTKELIGYFSLSTDAVRLTTEEKEESNLSDVAFMSLPAMETAIPEMQNR